MRIMAVVVIQPATLSSICFDKFLINNDKNLIFSLFNNEI